MEKRYKNLSTQVIYTTKNYGNTWAEGYNNNIAYELNNPDSIISLSYIHKNEDKYLEILPMALQSIITNKLYRKTSFGSYLCYEINSSFLLSEVDTSNFISFFSEEEILLKYNQNKETDSKSEKTYSFITDDGISLKEGDTVYYFSVEEIKKINTLDFSSLIKAIKSKVLNSKNIRALGIKYYATELTAGEEITKIHIKEAADAVENHFNDAVNKAEVIVKDFIKDVLKNPSIKSFFNLK